MMSKALIRVLVDMDGVLCDFEGHFLSRFRELHPDEPFIDLEDRRTFYLSEQYEKLKPGLREPVNRLVRSQGFFENIPPIGGAVKAVKEISSINGIEVFLCSTPVVGETLYCAGEKFNWVQRHLGDDWTDRLMLCKDKTLAYGDLLIDDKPRIKGTMSPPSWDHILFSQCHNKHLELSQTTAVQRLESWSKQHWMPLIDSYMKK